MNLPVEKTTEPFVGWRVWKFMRPNYLTDVNATTVHEPGQAVEAYCRVWEHTTSDHMAPKENCTCGFYACKTRQQLAQFGSMYEVGGEVWLWGKVIEYSEGFRAQFMYPKRIELWNPRLDPYAGYLEYVYRVPVVTGLQAPEKPPEPPKLPRWLVDFYAVAQSDKADLSSRRYAITQALNRLKRFDRPWVKEFNEKLLALRKQLREERE